MTTNRILYRLALVAALLALCSSSAVLPTTKVENAVAPSATKTAVPNTAPATVNPVVTPLPPEVRGDTVLRHQWRCSTCAAPMPSPEVEALERALSLVKDQDGEPLYKGTIDGRYGRKLNQAIGKYRRAQNLWHPEGGDVYDEEVYVSLRSYLSVMTKNDGNMSVTIPVIEEDAPSTAEIDDTSDDDTIIDADDVSSMIEDLSDELDPNTLTTLQSMRNASMNARQNFAKAALDNVRAAEEKIAYQNIHVAFMHFQCKVAGVPAANCPTSIDFSEAMREELARRQQDLLDENEEE